MKDKKEIILIKKRIDIMLKFLADKSNARPFFDETLMIIENEFHKNNLSGLITAHRDLSEWIRGIPLKERKKLKEELDALEQKRFDEQLQILIHGILTKQIIETEDEYRIILDKVDEIYNDENLKKDVEILNKLLADYDKKYFDKHK